MKTVTAFLSVLLISAYASSMTASQKTALEMAAVLQSAQIQSLLAQEDSVGSIRSISYIMSYRASFGPAIYELNFTSMSGPVPQACAVDVQLNTETKEVMKVSSVFCKEIK